MCMAPLAEYVGCIHVHSTYSDGSGSVADIVAAAQTAGLDYVILTDHRNMRARRFGQEGWYGRVLLLSGMEVGRHKGHVLAIGIRRGIRERPPDVRRMCELTTRQGGLAFIAHPCARGNRWLATRDQSWKSTCVRALSGLEVWSWMYDWFERVRWQGDFPAAYWWPERFLRGPSPDTLALWDTISAQQRCVGIGCLDAHAVKRWWLPGVVVFSYAYLFRTIRTHVFAPEPTGNALRDSQALLAALGRGRAFFAHHGQGDARGFDFRAEGKSGVLTPGDEALWEDGPVEFRVTVPQEGDIRVLRDGAIVSRVVARQAVFLAPGPGVYRIEVRRGERPWIFSNPIHLRTYLPAKPSEGCRT